MSQVSIDPAKHFSRQAEAYAVSAGHASDHDLDIVMAYSSPGLYDFCLDVATGPGHTALRLASRAVMVIGIDIADGMLATARRLAEEQALHNLSFQYGDAQALPFADVTFDLVTCRIAPHHFCNPQAFVREAARVLKPGGRLVIEDSLSPDDGEQAAYLHALERRRDPTHIRSLRREEWREILHDTGFRIAREAVYRKRHPFAQWLTRAGLPPAEVLTVEAEILATPGPLRDAFFEIEAGRVTYLNDEKLILRGDKPLA